VSWCWWRGDGGSRLGGGAVTLNQLSADRKTTPMPRLSLRAFVTITSLAAPWRPLAAQAASLDARIATALPHVVAWRRDLHEHPELSNRETRTAKVVADALRAMGLEVREKVAGTGVVAVLRGAKPGPSVALRADMDALPVTEEVDLPFKSTVRSTFNGQAVGVMHACGHDAHTAMLLGAAEVLAGMKSQLAGTVTFIFQPAEEGVPAGETGGAKQMVIEGALTNPAPTAVFGMHVWPEEVGKISYKAGAAMSASDQLQIIVKGRQTHGAQPWRGVDPVVVSAQIINALQTIPSRQTDVTLAPSIVTIGTINGGVRFNIIPDSVVMTGTIRSFDAAMRTDIHARIKRTAEKIAEASGATAQVRIIVGGNVVYNDLALTKRMAPTLARAAGGKINDNAVWMPSEDFPAFTEKTPGLYVFLGVNKASVGVNDAAANHSTQFFVNEDALPVGVRTWVSLALDYLAGVK
jgi:amidohydrolase